MKKTLKEIEQEVEKRFLPEKYANALAALRELDLDLEYLATPQGKQRLAQEMGSEQLEKKIKQLKMERDARQSFINFLKGKL